MPQIETDMEMSLIQQMVYGESQWTFRDDINTEEKLWENIRKKLEDHNRDKLQGTLLSDQEFQEVKNQLSFSTFYQAGRFLSGANGMVKVHVHRGNDLLDLALFDRNAVGGGTTCPTSYEIIHQYQVKGLGNGSDRDRRLDVTLLFNGLPLIHIELKNGLYSPFMDAFRQIQKYIDEGVFRGPFSMVQMFVISNGADTKYIAANDVLNRPFLTNWSKNEKKNTPVTNLFEFAKQVLKIPEAHRMVTDYLMLDNEKKSIILLRPYQIHAIEAIREASKKQKSGYIWHTTGSGKTLVSYKVARNLILDLKSVEKTIFLIDRKNLDDNTTYHFNAYAESDSVAVDKTDDTRMLEEKLLSPNRSMIVTTIQKLQKLLREYSAKDRNPSVEKKAQKARTKKIVFVVDECHRTVTKQTKASFDSFFRFPLWYGFTGTPIFKENQGLLGATTDEMYKERLHQYTIKNALDDKSVLPFQVEYWEPKDGREEDYESDEHMLRVLKVILEKCAVKFGIDNPIGDSYDAILSTGSIPKAQRYYDLLKEIKEGKHPSIVIPKEIKEKYPDFPRFAITYSLQENKEDSERNSSALSKDIADYDAMFGTGWRNDLDGYNEDLSKRLARKGDSFLSAKEQLDLVIVADRLLTGFDAPCLSTVFLDRPPQTPHNIIQTFSRTNRIYDDKRVGYIVTFQTPKLYETKVTDAIVLFTEGGTEGLAIAWKEAFKVFKESVASLLDLTPHPDDVDELSDEDKKEFCARLRTFDKAYRDVKGYVQWADRSLEDFGEGRGISDDDYQGFIGKYKNLMQKYRDERRKEAEDGGKPGAKEDGYLDYELVSYHSELIDSDYILRLMTQYINDVDAAKAKEIQEYIDTLTAQNSKIGKLLDALWKKVLESKGKQMDDITLKSQFEEARDEAKKKVVDDFCDEFFVRREDVLDLCSSIPQDPTLKIEKVDNLYGIQNLIDNSDDRTYKEKRDQMSTRYKYRQNVRKALKKMLNEDYIPLTKNF